MDRREVIEYLKNFYLEVKDIYLTSSKEYLKYTDKLLSVYENIDKELSKIKTYDDWCDLIIAIDCNYYNYNNNEYLKEIEKSFNILTNIVNSLD